MRFSGGALYQLRLKRDMSRADLAHAVRSASNGVVKATERGVRGWEKGEYVPGGDAVPALAAALACDVSELYSEIADADDAEAASTVAAAADSAEEMVAVLMPRAQLERMLAADRVRDVESQR